MLDCDMLAPETAPLLIRFSIDSSTVCVTFSIRVGGNSLIVCYNSVAPCHGGPSLSEFYATCDLKSRFLPVEHGFRRQALEGNLLAEFQHQVHALEKGIARKCAMDSENRMQNLYPCPRKGG
jgi:hypothetical protein